MTPEELYDANPRKILELKQQLPLARVQFERQQQMLLLAKTSHEQRSPFLGNEIRWLRTHVGEVLIHAKATHIGQIAGDLVNNNKVSVGNASDSTNIAVGKHNQ